MARPTRSLRTPIPALLHLVLLIWSALVALPAAAQAPADNPPAGLEQRTQRIIHEDKGSRIDELRVGGETRRIDVQTPSAVPAYQVAPQRGLDVPDSGLGQRSGSAGKSSWRVLNF